MITNYSVRKVCEDDDGSGKSFHYYRELQIDTLNKNIICPIHPDSITRNFVIEGIEII